MGAARVFEITKSPLTMTAEDGIGTARAVPDAKNCSFALRSWAHFSESREVITAAFRSAGIERRLHWLPAAKPTVVET